MGFYNRKFFVLFLFYTLLSTLWVLATFVPTFLEFGSWAVRRSPLRRGWTPTQFLVTWMALLVDGTLALMLCCSSASTSTWLRNTTTIEASARGFDVGWRKNLESVGTNPYLWFVPIWGTGPAGDGVHWERKPESGSSGRWATSRAAAAAARPVGQCGAVGPRVQRQLGGELLGYTSK